MKSLGNTTLYVYLYYLLGFLANRGALAILIYELFTATVNVHSGFGKNYRIGKISVPVSAKNSDFGRSLFMTKGHITKVYAIKRGWT